MDVDFIKYQQIDERFQLGITDPTTGFKRYDFTVDSFQTFIKSKSNAGLHLRIQQAIENKGGIEWVRSEIVKYQKSKLNGKEI